jgi:hypothetical protein
MIVSHTWGIVTLVENAHPNRDEFMMKLPRYAVGAQGAAG